MVRPRKSFYRGNFSAARSDWEPLAEKGDCDAQFRLGILYFQEQGVKLDVQKAISLWTTAAEGGQPRAQYTLGNLYFNSPEDTSFTCRLGRETIKKTEYCGCLQVVPCGRKTRLL